MRERIKAVWKRSEPARKVWAEVEALWTFLQAALQVASAIGVVVGIVAIVTAIGASLLGILSPWWPLVVGILLMVFSVGVNLATRRVQRAMPVLASVQSESKDAVIELPIAEAKAEALPPVVLAGNVLAGHGELKVTTSREKFPDVQIIEAFSSSDTLSQLLMGPAIFGREIRHKDFTIEAAIYADGQMQIREVYLAVKTSALDAEVSIAPTRFESFGIARSLIRSFMFAIPMKIWNAGFSFRLDVVTSRGTVSSDSWEYGIKKPPPSLTEGEANDNDEE